MVPVEKEMDILKRIPHKRPFRFIDEIIAINGDFVRGAYTFRMDEFFYTGHFPNHPTTPEAILIETMGQIGVLPLGIFLMNSPQYYSNIIFTSSDVCFFQIVYPGQKVIVESQKIYFRHNILKCDVKMFHTAGSVVCSGLLCGMLLTELPASRELSPGQLLID